ncbi:pectate lyase superfamily protein-domain-containing protein [Xylaria sp. FL1777]|nr:pectate lyase superfamily protein-domain-containing protein [Xylaria sp. FL1777]
MWVVCRIALLCACLTFHFLVGFSGSASASPQVARRSSVIPRQASLSPFVTTQNASLSDIEAARQIVQDAITKMTKLNKARLAKPNRNNSKLKRNNDANSQLLEITNEIARAAALLAELEATPVSNATIPSPASIEKRAGTFWMEGIARKGTVPWGNDASYKVFRNVVNDYGADPTGQRDSTQAIQRAIDDGKRCGAACNGSTTKNAIVYFPPGRYLVSSSINIYFGTQIIGDANNWPTIVGAASFVGLGVLSTDVYVDNGGQGPDGNPLEWYINTARFYSQIRNIRVDITATNAGAYVAALHYQVAQATTLENVELIANSATVSLGLSHLKY